jgi:dolichol-phosphate mannosyltransferase
VRGSVGIRGARLVHDPSAIMTVAGLEQLSVVIPAHNEEGSIGATVTAVVSTLREAQIDYEIVVVNDRCDDGTEAVVRSLMAEDPRIVLTSTGSTGGGFGLAIQAGLAVFSGDAVAIVMADGSDDPEDLVVYHRLLAQGFDCAFGSRFMRGARVVDYPWTKLIINRIANLVVRLLFRHGYNDTTNAFKAYRREVIEAVHPLLSHHFNLTVELPLKAVVRGFTFGVVPVSWRNRTSGESKLRLEEMGSRYVFIVLYVLLEDLLSKGDYRPAALRGLSTRERRRQADRPRARRSL